MTILVIGATGFIGNTLTNCARATGHRVIGCSRSDWKGKIINQFPKREDYWCSADGEKPKKLMDEADCLVLLAGKRPYPGFCFDDYAYNISVAQRYMTLAIKNGMKNVVFASSKAVYSGADMPWREERFYTPSSLYGSSK